MGPRAQSRSLHLPPPADGPVAPLVPVVLEQQEGAAAVFDQEGIRPVVACRRLVPTEAGQAGALGRGPEGGRAPPQGDFPANGYPPLPALAAHAVDDRGRHSGCEEPDHVPRRRCWDDAGSAGAGARQGLRTYVLPAEFVQIVELPNDEVRRLPERDSPVVRQKQVSAAAEPRSAQGPRWQPVRRPGPRAGRPASGARSATCWKRRNFSVACILVCAEMIRPDPVTGSS